MPKHISIILLKIYENKLQRLLFFISFIDLIFIFIRLFSISLSFDNEYLNGKCSRHPNTNLCFNQLSKRLEEAIRITEQTSLSEKITFQLFSSTYFELI